MADDDIEKLLKEVDQLSGASAAASRSQTPVTRSETKSRQGRFPFALAIGVVLGGFGFVAGLLFPFVGGFSAGVGAALGAFTTALITGPPRWFSR